MFLHHYLSVQISLFHFKMFIIAEGTPRRNATHTDDATETNAFFISLVATNDRGFPCKEYYLYDVATEIELQSFSVKFLSLRNIKEFYFNHSPDFDDEKADIYQMTHFFIQMHKGSSFFLDEVPFISNENFYYDCDEITSDDDSNADDDVADHGDNKSPFDEDCKLKS